MPSAISFVKQSIMWFFISWGLFSTQTSPSSRRKKNSILELGKNMKFLSHCPISLRNTICVNTSSSIFKKSSCTKKRNFTKRTNPWLRKHHHCPMKKHQLLLVKANAQQKPALPSLSSTSRMRAMAVLHSCGSLIQPRIATVWRKMLGCAYTWWK